MLKKIISLISCISFFSLLLMNLNLNEKISAIDKQPLEILSMRSQYEKHYDNGDGTYTAVVGTAPFHYDNGNGEWVEIDNTLIQNVDGSYTNSKNSMNVTLAPTAKINSINYMDSNSMNGCHLVSLNYMGHNIS